ncbi:MAG: flagellar biosynthesis protein FlhA, partial [Pseudomonadota bacterium]|nr:flagellar biosynthesis protein FlhA [Pseudomonadota bacterium]
MSEAAPDQSTDAGGTSAEGGGGAPFEIPEYLKRGDIALALGVIAILVVLLLPMPTWLLDFSLAISITFSVVILMTVLFIKNPLELNTFPTILLIATMLRLALNLASTRLILADGHTGTASAGRVIEAFGNFVVGGNYVIGIIVFGILVIVNFVVITKGAGRIAEVAARFSLDAMPGKQMAIDADLSSGLIGEDEARKRRSSLEEENSFFGAMDGASKFVRGDAIAGLLITFINIIGGIIIGTAQQNMSLGNAAETYTLLTIGDGLVTQIPALIVSTAAGMLVTRSGVQGAADEAVLGQLTNYPVALTLATGLLLTIAVLPGIPALPFLILAGVTGATAFALNKRRQEEEDEEARVEEEKQSAPPLEEPIGAALQIDNIRLELGYGLLSLINNPSERRLTEQIKALRRQLASEMGFIMPAVRIQDNLQLPPNNYILRVKEIEAGNGELRPNMLLVMDPRGEQIALPGEATVEPTFGLPAMWVGEQHREEAMFQGFTVVDAPTVITTHLTEIIRDNMSELLSYSETQKLLDELDGGHQKLIADLVPNQINIGGIQRVLQNLLGERVSIRDLATILEGVSEACGYTRNIGQITEHVRARLARQLSDDVVNEKGFIPLVTLSPEWEQSFAESIVGQG